MYFLCGDSESETMGGRNEQNGNLVNDKRCSCMHLTKSDSSRRKNIIEKLRQVMHLEKRTFGFFKSFLEF